MNMKLKHRIVSIFKLSAVLIAYGIFWPLAAWSIDSGSELAGSEDVASDQSNIKFCDPSGEPLEELGTNCKAASCPEHDNVYPNGDDNNPFFRLTVNKAQAYKYTRKMPTPLPPSSVVNGEPTDETREQQLNLFKIDYGSKMETACTTMCSQSKKCPGNGTSISCKCDTASIELKRTDGYQDLAKKESNQYYYYWDGQILQINFKCKC